jgi:hypothetical protein
VADVAWIDDSASEVSEGEQTFVRVNDAGRSSSLTLCHAPLASMAVSNATTTTSSAATTTVTRPPPVAATTAYTTAALPAATPPPPPLPRQRRLIITMPATRQSHQRHNNHQHHPTTLTRLPHIHQVLLLLFNDTDGEVPVSDLEERTGLPLAQIGRALLSLSVGKHRVLVKSTTNTEVTPSLIFINRPLLLFPSFVSGFSLLSYFPPFLYVSVFVY